MKKIITFLMTFVLVLGFSVTAFADVDYDDYGKSVIDEANVLSNRDEEELTEEIQKIESKYNFDIVICTVETVPMGYTAQSYADYVSECTTNIYDSCVLVIGTQDRTWAISTTGFGQRAFTLAGIDYIMDKLSDNGLKDGKYVKAFKKFVSLCDDFIKEAKDGKPYDKGHMPQTKGQIFKKALVRGLIIGLVVTLIVILSLVGQMKNVRKKTEAREYVVNGSLNVTLARDAYLYSKTSKTRKAQQSSGSGSHTSSSGGSHGGSSGSF